MDWALRPMVAIAGYEAGRGQAAYGMLREDFKWEGSLEEVRERTASHVEKVLLKHHADCKWNKTGRRRS